MIAPGEVLVEPRWDAARAAVAGAVSALPPRTTPLADCDRLVLAEAVVARIALPSFDTSAMDGWAVRGPGPWQVVGEVLAGRAAGVRLDPGEAVMIATGAVVPDCADAVIRSEDGEVTRGVGGEMLRAPVPTGASHVRGAGEECVQGETLAAPGVAVTPALIGLAAAAGLDDLLVVPRPRVALVLFGDELATTGVPESGRVRDSLGPQIPAWLARLGAQAVMVQRCEDTLAAHIRALGSACAAADIVLTTGGTAAGPVDHLHRALAACGGSLVVDSVAVRPGHPMLAATVGRTWVVGLPGNPQSAVVALMSLAAPILAGLSGRDPLPRLATATASGDLASPADEDRLVLGTLADGVFQPGNYLGSGMLRGLAGATGFGVLPPGGVQCGDQVRWLPLPG